MEKLKHTPRRQLRLAGTVKLAAESRFIESSSMRDHTQLSPAAERIVDVAEALIQRQGFNGFSYEDIAQSVGIRKPSVHHHFATKVELASVVTQRYVDRFLRDLEDIEHSVAAPADRLVAYAELFHATYQKNRQLCLCGMLAAESETLPESVREPLRVFFDLNLQWLAKAITWVRPDRSADAPGLALLLLSALEGSMLVARQHINTDAPQQVARVFLQQLLKT
jgi:TetR/AcrR family transcriptional repressor of nem operon